MRYGSSLSGIGDIEVNKDELIDVLRKNRENHDKLFEEALGKFRDRAIERLDSLIQILRDGRVPSSLQVGLPIPEEHSDDYDRAIHMLEMHRGDSITLSEQAYMQLVDDEWGWQSAFAANTLAYTSSAPPRNGYGTADDGAESFA